VLPTSPLVDLTEENVESLTGSSDQLTIMNTPDLVASQVPYKNKSPPWTGYSSSPTLSDIVRNDLVVKEEENNSSPVRQGIFGTLLGSPTRAGVPGAGNRNRSKSIMVRTTPSGKVKVVGGHVDIGPGQSSSARKL
jgi:hypothetical protein